MITRIPGAAGELPRVPTASRAWGSLAACAVVVFMQMLDLTVVHTAIPAVARDLGAGASAQLLIVSIYGLGFACTLLTAAQVGTLIGRRRVFLTATVGFAAASLWCGTATGPAELVLARGVAGIAAAAASAQTIAIITGAFTQRNRAVAFGVYGAVAGLAGLAGPLVGGALVDADLLGSGWRAIFLINVPLSLVAVLVAYRNVRTPGPLADTATVAATAGWWPTVRRLDLPGALMSACGLGMLEYPLTAGVELGWPPALLAMLALSVPTLAAFGWSQHRRARAGAEPLLRPELFEDRDFGIGAVLMAVFYGMFTALLFTVSVTAQTGLGWSASRTGLLMLPFALGAAGGALSSPILVSRWGSRVLTVGVTVFAVALGAAAQTIHRAGSAVDIGALAGPVLAAGAAMGWFAAPLPSIMLRGTADEAAGSASGLVPVVQQLGSCLGVAALGTVFFERIAQRSYIDAITTVLCALVVLSLALAALSLALPGRRP